MSKLLKKSLIASASLLMLASIGAGTSNVSVNARHRHVHHVYHRSAWHRGIPSSARGHYASYSHIRHGKRTLINVNPQSVMASFHGSINTFGLINARTKKLGHDRYMITGHDVEATNSRKPSNFSIVLTRTRHGAYIRIIHNKLVPKHSINGHYYRCRYSYIFRSINGEM